MVSESSAKPDTVADPIVEPETVQTDLITEPMTTDPEPLAAKMEELARRRELELDEIEAHNIEELLDFANHGSVRLSFTLGKHKVTEECPQPCTRKLVRLLERADMRVLQEPHVFVMTDSLISPILWYELYRVHLD